MGLGLNGVAPVGGLSAHGALVAVGAGDVVVGVLDVGGVDLEGLLAEVERQGCWLGSVRACPIGCYE